MNKKKCKYCNNQIDSSKIRCNNCNLIWEDGVKFGKEEIKQKLEHIKNVFKGLLK